MIDIIAKTFDYVIEPGWLEVRCERCNEKCYIGPQQREGIKKLGYENCRVVCNHCEKVQAHRAVLASEILDKPLPEEHKSG